MPDAILGRRRELDVMGEWLDAARDRAGRLVLCAGEPGIGKTRLAQEVAGIALAGGRTVAWGRCLEAEGSPAFWPWRQVLRSLDVDHESLLGASVDSPEDRFRVLEGVVVSVRGAAQLGALVVILDDIHWADEPSLLVLRHLAHQVADVRLLVLATFRDVEPAGHLRRVLPDLLRAPSVERIDLRGFGLAEVREELSRMGARSSATDAPAVLEVTGGNPLFVREVARAMADGTWRRDRPPRTVLDLVGDRLGRVTASCRRLVQAAAIVGRDFSLTLVAGALDEPVEGCLLLADEAISYGLVDRVDTAGEYRFVHALTREAVGASLTTAERAVLHRAVAMASEAMFAGDLSGHLGDIARHWAELAPYGEAARARAWAVRAADDAVRRLAFAEGARLYRSALGLGAGSSMDDVERCRMLISLGRAAYLAGDVAGCVDAAIAAAEAARRTTRPELAGEAALVVEVTADPAVNVVAEQLCQQALEGLGTTGHAALRARLLAQLSHIAFYDGDGPRVESLSGAALELARAAADDQALAAAFHARKEACPGEAGRQERMSLAAEMVALGSRTRSPRSVMWGELWRTEALIERGELASAFEWLARLQAAVEQVGGPVSAWHHDRVAACIAQAQGRYAEAAAIARRGLERMREVEPGPARGSYFALHCALAGHLGITEDVAPFVQQQFTPLPRFTSMAPLMRAYLLMCAGRHEEAGASYAQAGPVATWRPSPFYMLVCHVVATVTAAEVGRREHLPILLERLAPFRGQHASGDGVLYMGPVELALGRGAAALGRLDDAVADLSAAAELADRAGARGFVAEARFHLAAALAARNGPGDHAAALAAAGEADRQVRSLGMAAYGARAEALLASLAGARATLSPREAEVVELVAEGLTNRQIADRLVISARTAQNHVQHILTKLGFTTRSQIAAWHARTGAGR